METLLHMQWITIVFKFQQQKLLMLMDKGQTTRAQKMHAPENFQVAVPSVQVGNH